MILLSHATQCNKIRGIPSQPVSIYSRVSILLERAHIRYDRSMECRLFPDRETKTVEDQGLAGVR